MVPGAEDPETLAIYATVWCESEEDCQLLDKVTINFQEYFDLFTKGCYSGKTHCITRNRQAGDITEYLFTDLCNKFKSCELE